MRYRLSKIAAVCGGVLSGCDGVVNRVIVDSRSVPVNDKTLFVAIRTRNRDGADFIGDLYARGVRGFLVGGDFSEASQYPEAGFVAVKDTVAALQALAAHYRDSFKGKVVGITGSYGKTIVKEWIAQLTPPGVTLFRSPKSWNSQIGVPLSVLMAAGDEDYIVIEAGISKPDEMLPLWNIIYPKIGIITSVGSAHIENFNDRNDLLAEKLKLFSNCPTIIYNGKSRIISAAALHKQFPETKLIGVSSIDDSFEGQNSLIAIKFWESQGYKIPQDASKNLEAIATRLEVKEGLYKNSLIINDTYNSDINSLGIAINYLARVSAGRGRTVIMSDIVVTGDSEEYTYGRAAELINEAGIGQFIGIGTKMAKYMTLFGSYASHYPTVDHFLHGISSVNLQDQAILIKGGASLGFDRLSRALERRSHTTVMEVDLDAMRRNLHLCRERIASSNAGIIPMIKAGAYGHGTFEVARMLEAEGADYLAVAFADEGVELREAGISMPIVVLNADADSFEPMIAHRLEPEIYNFVALREFVALVKRHGERNYPIHIKLDTGMHRLGFAEDEIPALMAALSGADRYVRVATVFSHLSSADNPAEDDFTRGQIDRFDRLGRALASALPYPVRRHLAATSGIERFPDARFDLVRLGIGLYGFGMRGAEPVARLRTRIVHVAEHAAGETVGYGRRGVLGRPSRIATIPMGYADGLSRRLSCGKWSVLVGGEGTQGEGTPGGTLAPIVGNVCMDSCMIDVTDAGNVRVGDEAVIFSAAPGNTVEDMARILDTIPYEVLTSVSSRVKRIYIKE